MFFIWPQLLKIWPQLSPGWLQIFSFGERDGDNFFKARANPAIWYGIGDVLTNSGTFWLWDVLTEYPKNTVASERTFRMKVYHGGGFGPRFTYIVHEYPDSFYFLFQTIEYSKTIKITSQINQLERPRLSHPHLTCYTCLPSFPFRALSRALAELQWGHLPFLYKQTMIYSK